MRDLDGPYGFDREWAEAALYGPNDKVGTVVLGLQTPKGQRVMSDSINFPQSQEEALRAVINSAMCGMTSENFHGVDLSCPFTTDAGFGLKRTEDQARWLENARLRVQSELVLALEELV